MITLTHLSLVIRLLMVIGTGYVIYEQNMPKNGERRGPGRAPGWRLGIGVCVRIGVVGGDVNEVNEENLWITFVHSFLTTMQSAAQTIECTCTT